jgi:hypothetical protein
MVPVMLHPLLLRREAILNELAQLVPQAPGGQPSYTVEGQQVDHTAYRLSLYTELQQIMRLLASEVPPTEDLTRAET